MWLSFESDGIDERSSKLDGDLDVVIETRRVWLRGITMVKLFKNIIKSVRNFREWKP